MCETKKNCLKKLYTGHFQRRRLRETADSWRDGIQARHEGFINTHSLRNPRVVSCNSIGVNTLKK